MGWFKSPRQAQRFLLASFRVGDAPVVPIVISGENRHGR